MKTFNKTTGDFIRKCCVIFIFITLSGLFVSKLRHDILGKSDNQASKETERLNQSSRQLKPEVRSSPARPQIVNSKAAVFDFLNNLKGQISDQDFQDFLVEALTSNQFNRPENDHPMLLGLSLSAKVDICNRFASEASYRMIMAKLIARTTKDDIEKFYDDGVRHITNKTLRSSLIGQITSKLLRDSLHDLNDSQFLCDVYDQSEKDDRATMYVRVISSSQSQIHSNKLSIDEFEEIIGNSFFSDSEKSLIVSQIRERLALGP